MKKLYYLLFALSALVISGCGADDTEEIVLNEIEVVSPELNYDAAGDTRQVNVSSETSWTVASTESWCVITPLSGVGHSVISVKAVANTGTAAREAFVVFTSARGQNIKVPVAQDGASPFVSFPGSSELTATPPQRYVSFEVQTNSHFDVSSETNWIKLFSITPNSTGNGKIVTMQLKGNFTTTTRSGSFTIQSSVENTPAKSVSVNQESSVVVLEDLWGNWNLAEYYYSGGWKTRQYTVSIAKADNSNIRITGLGGYSRTVNATADINNLTVTIPPQKVAALEEGYDTWFTNAARAFNAAAPHMQNVVAKIAISEGNLMILLDPNQDDTNGYMLSATDTDKQNYLGFYTLGGAPGYMTKL